MAIQTIKVVIPKDQQYKLYDSFMTKLIGWTVKKTDIEDEFEISADVIESEVGFKWIPFGQ